MKTLLCCIAKNENKYINDWITYHKNIGFDKILIYDNNDIDGEILNVSDAEVINYRGKRKEIKNLVEALKLEFYYGVQEEAYNDCYLNHSNDYDWIAYLDVDEYLVIDMSINEFLNQDKFSDVDAIQINWEIYGDNGKLRYENIPVMERFTTPVLVGVSSCVKTIVKTRNPNFHSLRIHYADIKDGKYVYPNGEKTIPSFAQIINYEGARIKHFYTKTIEEWIDRKYNGTSADGWYYRCKPDKIVLEFFKYNEYTEEKLNIIKDKMNEY